jgi:hypothetical protein
MSAANRPDLAGLTTIRTVGALIPADLLARIVTGSDLPGLTADDYRLELGVSPREAANRAWSVLTGAWAAYRDALAKRPEGDRATGLTRDKWLSVLLRELDFGRVPTTPAGGIQADGRSFPISHQWRDVPVHLLGWGVDLDRKTPGVAGAADRAPHAMVQELLNRSDEHLWAMLANGGTLRLLRDSSSLVGQSYVEFDLQAMFDGEIFSDFAVLFFLCHQTRFEPVDPDAGPEDCWLERWRTDAVETGARALGALRVGVQRAIEALGTGFLQHPANSHLRQRIDSDLTLADYHRALLRLVYRLLFCFVAEDRDLLLDRDAATTARQRYTDWFSTAHLRHIAVRRRGNRHSDLWQGLSIVLDGLGTEGGRPELGLPGLGGIFENGPADVVTGAQLGNDALLAAFRHLVVIQPPGGGPKRTVDYRNLGAEELGGIYESLLEFVPRYDLNARSFSLESLVGNERKTSGAYYTPTSLIDCLLDSALDPLLDDAEAADNAEDALLSLTVCDPACGSGHFLVASARRIAARVARTRAEGSEPTVLDAQAAMHDVVAKCIYGVDLNPMAAELAKVSLWLEALQPGRPLSFLDAHIKVGNALLGTTPALLAQGIPDEAFVVLQGDDKQVVSSLKKQNRQEREGQGDLFARAGIRVDNSTFAEAVRAIDSAPAMSLADIHLSEQRQRAMDASPELRRSRLIADGWCAAFVLEKTGDSPRLTHATLDAWQSRSLEDLAADPVRDEVERLASSYRFFHWHLEFPTIFSVPESASSTTESGWQGGFACVVGNPPWEHVELKEQEFFASLDPEIASASGSARKDLIRSLAERNPQLSAEFLHAKRHADGERHLLGSSGRFPLCGRGRINTYAVFAEADRSLLASTGRLGVILPAGIATDATTQHFFKDLVRSRTLASLWHFENEALVFANVHHAFKFVLLAVTGLGTQVPSAEFSFYARQVADLARPDARFALTPDELTLLNPNTGTCPVFRSRRDAELTLRMYASAPVLIDRNPGGANPWGLSFMQGLFNTTGDSEVFRSRADLESDGWRLDGNIFRRGGREEMLPVYEAKMFHNFEHRWATYDDDGNTREVSDLESADAEWHSLPRYWAPATEVRSGLADRWAHDWLVCYRRITLATNLRTSIVTVLPLVATTDGSPSLFAAAKPHMLCAALNSIPLDFAARQRVGGTHLDFFHVEQLPVPPPDQFDAVFSWTGDQTVEEWLTPRCAELLYTSWEMKSFGEFVGDVGPPFRWNENRRAILRAEVDAAFFHLYGVGSDDVEYILGTFPVVNRSDIARHGEERTRRLVLEAYDRVAVAIKSGQPFVSSLDPPPGQGARHPERTEVS